MRRRSYASGPSSSTAGGIVFFEIRVSSWAAVMESEVLEKGRHHRPRHVLAQAFHRGATLVEVRLGVGRDFVALAKLGCAAAEQRRSGVAIRHSKVQSHHRLYASGAIRRWIDDGRVVD